MKRSTIWLAAADHEAIRCARERYGLSTDSDVIRLAIHVLAVPLLP